MLKGSVTSVSKAQTDVYTLKQLLPTLYNNTHITTADYSKVSRGLHFPLEISGLRTRESVRLVLVRDTEYLVTPFMQVTIQMTRHFATLRKLQLLPPFTGPWLP